MIESLMLIALGFFIASLFAMIGAQFVWRRAVTVTLRNLGVDGADAGTENDGKTEENRQAELDAMIRRHERDLAPLKAEIGRLKSENAGLSEAQQRLEAERESLAAECEKLRSETEKLRMGLDALRNEMTAAAADTAKQAASIASASRELGAIEEALTARTRQFEAAQERLAALDAPAPASPPIPESEAGQELELREGAEQDEDARTLAEVKASLLAELDAAPDTGAPAERDEEDDLPRDEPPGGARSLAERIRALEAGVAH
ncbi:MAG TPA: hypothetical protein DCF73_16510 [Rhodobiaceae bacterium]|jgi:septal ring factor EnvC (AmiA/AmiB activator)|nr:hypothetical protein [Rhodobiaceae bacterium]